MTSSYVMTSATARILNSLIDGLNENNRLPRFLLIALDKDVIGDLKMFDFGVSKNLLALVNWLTRQIDIVIRHKKLQISEKKPGALGSKEDPVIIYINMLRCAQTYDNKSKLAQVCSLYYKFNSILDDAAARQDHKVINIRSCSSYDCFDSMGNLSNRGKVAFWHKVDELLEKYDRSIDEITPRHPVDDRKYENFRKCQTWY